MKDEKQKEPAADVQTSSKHKTEAKRLLHDRKKELDSPEAKILLRFLEAYPPGDVSLAALELLWTFLKWLRSEKISLVDPRDIFYAPFSHLAAAKNLK